MIPPMLIRCIIAFTCGAVLCVFIAKFALTMNVVPLAKQVQPTARIELSSDTTIVTYDEDKDTALAEFLVRNKGDLRLLIHTRESNCDCSLGPAGFLKVPPRSQKTLTISIPMANLKHLPRFDMTLTTNDPLSRECPVSIEVKGAPAPDINVNAKSVLNHQ